VLPAEAENPDAQGGQTEAPITALEVPGGQGVHDSVLAPQLENDAAGQLPDGDDSPGVLQYLPGKHGVQSGVEALLTEKEPKGQSPLAAESPWDEQCFPGGQGWHVCWPMNEFKYPTGHGVQAADTADPVEYEPTGQSPLISTRPAAAQYLPAGQGVQADELAPPEENDPGEHLPLTEVRPVPLQNAPASHRVHAT
jgi:hypothetical protein